MEAEVGDPFFDTAGIPLLAIDAPPANESLDRLAMIASVHCTYKARPCLVGGCPDWLEFLTVTDGAFLGNQAIAGPGGSVAHAFQTGFGAGGALDDSFSSTATLIDTILIGNAALGSDGGRGANGGDGWGGGISVGINGTPGLGFPPDASSLTLIDTTLDGNLAQGGDGGRGADGGNGLGGGLMIAAVDSTANVKDSDIIGNLALGGGPGAGGSAGQGIGGGVYTLGTFTDDPATVIKKNHASTSHDNIGP